MCVACSMMDADRGFSYYIGHNGIKNFIPKSRGEGNPAPRLMWRGKRVGIEIAASRIRRWLQPEFYVGGYRPVRSVMWGCFHICWRTD